MSVVLPAVHRLRRAGDFRAALRSGVRAGSALLVVHAAHLAESVDADGERPAQIGLIVSKAVGPAVVRNRVKRRLRHQLAARLDRLSPGAVYVVRANPLAASASSYDLAAALDRCLPMLTPGRAAGET